MVVGKKKFINNIRFNLLWISCLLIILDQVFKALIVARKPMIDLFVITIHHVTNTGASFGLLSGQNMLFIWISFIVIGLLMMFYDQLPKKAIPWLMLVGGGIISNLIDRIFRGAVIDYLDLGWWPVFNIADSMIVVGVLILIYVFVKEDKKH